MAAITVQGHMQPLFILPLHCLEIAHFCIFSAPGLANTSHGTPHDLHRKTLSMHSTDDSQSGA